MLHKTHWKDQRYKQNRYHYDLRNWRDRTWRISFHHKNYNRAYMCHVNGEWFWVQRWRSAGMGKFHKRKLSKMRRQFFKGTGRESSYVRWQSECNWKGS